MRTLLHWLAAAASFFGLFFTLNPTDIGALGPWQTLILTIAFIVFFGAAILDIFDARKHAVRQYKTEQEINDYMLKMLTNSGKCEICSRDASWINDPKIYRVLQQKAREEELLFLVHTKTKALEALGAEIIEYGQLGFELMTRFTVVNAGNLTSSYVAIGRRKPNEPHIIEELDSSHPTYSLAIDLIKSIKKSHGKSIQTEKNIRHS